jgi:DNA-binding response OmpR family regulator
MSSRYRVLVVDTDLSQTSVRKSLGRDFDVVCASSASEALEQLETSGFDAIIQEINLPDRSGFQLCADIVSDERYRDIPVIVLSDRSETQDKVMAFSLGAQDFVSKPYDPLELRARIEARARLRGDRLGKVTVVRVGDIEIDASYQRVTLRRAGEPPQAVSLTMVEFRILYCMATRKEMVLSRSQLLEEVWGKNLYVLDRTVDKHICSLRAKLMSDTHAIKTVTGVGYRLSAL